MFVSRDILAGALSIATKGDIGFIAIEPDGTVVALNRMIIYAGQPVTKEMITRIPLDNSPSVSETIYFSVGMIENIIKSISRDTLFKKVLEHADLSCKVDTLEVTVTITDGKGKRTLRINRSKVRTFPQWRAAFNTSFIAAPRERFIWNRKRLCNAVKGIELACQYEGEFAPVFIAVGKSTTVWRVSNELTGQRVLLSFAESEVEGGYPEYNAWEKEIFRKKIVLTKRNKCVICIGTRKTQNGDSCPLCVK